MQGISLTRWRARKSCHSIARIAAAHPPIQCAHARAGLVHTSPRHNWCAYVVPRAGYLICKSKVHSPVFQSSTFKEYCKRTRTTYVFTRCRYISNPSSSKKLSNVYLEAQRHGLSDPSPTVTGNVSDCKRHSAGVRTQDAVAGYYNRARADGTTYAQPCQAHGTIRIPFSVPAHERTTFWECSATASRTPTANIDYSR